MTDPKNATEDALSTSYASLRAGFVSEAQALAGLGVGEARADLDRIAAKPGTWTQELREIWGAITGRPWHEADRFGSRDVAGAAVQLRGWWESASRERNAAAAQLATERAARVKELRDIWGAITGTPWDESESHPKDTVGAVDHLRQNRDALIRELTAATSELDTAQSDLKRLAAQPVTKPGAWTDELREIWSAATGRPPHEADTYGDRNVRKTVHTLRGQLEATLGDDRNAEITDLRRDFDAVKGQLAAASDALWRVTAERDSARKERNECDTEITNLKRELEVSEAGRQNLLTLTRRISIAVGASPVSSPDEIVVFATAFDRETSDLVKDRNDLRLCLKGVAAALGIPSECGPRFVEAVGDARKRSETQINGLKCALEASESVLRRVSVALGVPQTGTHDDVVNLAVETREKLRSATKQIEIYRDEVRERDNIVKDRDALRSCLRDVAAMFGASLECGRLVEAVHDMKKDYDHALDELKRYRDAASTNPLTHDVATKLLAGTRALWSKLIDLPVEDAPESVDRLLDAINEDVDGLHRDLAGYRKALNEVNNTLREAVGDEPLPRVQARAKTIVRLCKDLKAANIGLVEENTKIENDAIRRVLTPIRYAAKLSHTATPEDIARRILDLARMADDTGVKRDSDRHLEKLLDALDCGSVEVALRDIEQTKRLVRSVADAAGMDNQWWSAEDVVAWVTNMRKQLSIIGDAVRGEYK